MQFQVPQFIETEDKIVGPLSLKQFIYVGIGAVLCFILYFFVQTWLFILGSVVILAAAGSMAFLKVNGMPLIRVATSALNFYWKPQTYVWKPDAPKITLRPEQDEAAGTPKKEKESGIPLEKLFTGAALHKTWENLQSGSPPPEEKDAHKQSDRQFIEKKMEERYQIFQKLSGARDAARRVDYR